MTLWLQITPTLKVFRTHVNPECEFWSKRRVTTRAKYECLFPTVHECILVINCDFLPPVWTLYVFYLHHITENREQEIPFLLAFCSRPEHGHTTTIPTKLEGPGRWPHRPSTSAGSPFLVQCRSDDQETTWKLPVYLYHLTPSPSKSSSRFM